MSNDLKLICEDELSNATDIHLLVEDEGKGKKTYKVRGPYIVTEQKNANGRTYDAEVMEQSVNTYIKEYVKTRRAVGEMNHPDSVDVNYEKACHLITSLKREGDIWIGESQILTGTPNGDLYAGLIKNGVSTGMSTRGVGNVDSDGRVDEFKLVAVDVVFQPSGPGAFVDGILESKNFLIDEHGQIVERAYTRLEKSLSTLPVRDTDKANLILSAISNFISEI